MSVGELVVGAAVAAEAAVVVDAVVDPHKLGEDVEGDPLEVGEAVEGDPLEVGEEDAAGKGEGVVPKDLVVGGEAVAVPATARWSPNAGGLTLVARL